MPNVYCEYCGLKSNSVSNLTFNACPKHPNGQGKGKHSLYQGSEKAKYTCKFCGITHSTIAALTFNTCPRHANGAHKGHHEPAL